MRKAEFDHSQGLDPEDDGRYDVAAHDQEPDLFDDDFDSKTVKIALGSIAAGGLLVGIYALAHNRLNKKKEQ